MLLGGGTTSILSIIPDILNKEHIHFHGKETTIEIINTFK